MTAQQPRVYAKDREFLWKGQGTITNYVIAQGEPEKTEACNSLDKLAAILVGIPEDVRVDYDSESRARIVSYGFGGFYVDSIRGLYEQEQHELRTLIAKKRDKQASNTQEPVSC